jgi:hypothetical protein
MTPPAGHAYQQLQVTPSPSVAELVYVIDHQPTWAREILLDLTRGEPARQSRSRRVESAIGIRLSQMASH